MLNYKYIDSRLMGGCKMYKFSYFRDNGNFCLEVQTPFGREFYVFRNREEYHECLKEMLYQMKKNGHKYTWERE